MSSKKRKPLSIKEKIKILNEVDSNILRKEIWKKYGIGESTLSRIIKNRKEIEDSVQVWPTVVKKRRTNDYPKLDEVLLTWYVHQRSEDIPLTGPLLIEKANQFCQQLSIQPKMGEISMSWINRFKERHGIVFRPMQGESGTVSKAYVQNWLKDVYPILSKNYDDKDIFNADEMGLFYNMLPNQSLAFKGEKCPGGKMAQVRVTVLVCANKIGTEKSKLIVIGRFKQPKCLKDFQMANLPVSYYGNSKAWMTSPIFEEFVRKWDSILRQSKRNILLLADNCPAHPVLERLTNIKLVILPPNAASVLQPMAQGIIKNLKHFYRHELLKRQIEAVDQKTEFKPSMKDVIFMLTTAWDLVKSETIKNCFKRALQLPNVTEDEFLNTIEGNNDMKHIEGNLFGLARQAGEEIPLNYTIEAFEEFDNDLITCGFPTDEEVLDQVLLGDLAETQNNDHTEDMEVEESLPTLGEAQNCLKRLRDWTLSNINSERLNGTLCSVLGSLEYEMTQHHLSILHQRYGTK